MAKKVLVISTSIRAKSNSERLAEAFAQGAREAGNVVTELSLKGKQLNFCRGCQVCQKTNRCVIQDDVAEIVEQMRQAEVIAFATPIYFFEMCGQMKTLLDRTEPLYQKPVAFRQIYLLSAAGDPEDWVDERAKSGLQGWIDCYENVTLAGTVLASGVDAGGSIEGHPALQQAYQMGQAIGSEA